MKHRSRLVLAWFGAFTSAACGGGDDPGEPRPVAGEYAMFLANGPSECPFETWEEGLITEDVVLTITQIDDSVVATVGDPIQSFLMAESGTNRFVGSVGETDMVLDLVGEIFQLEGNCSFTINATLDTEIIGDFLRGELRYVGSTNNNPDCTPIEGCVSVQAFNAIRPPQPPPGLADAGVPDPPDAGAAP